MNFSAPATALDYLAQNEILTLTYTVAVDDGDGGVTSKTFAVTITGTNDFPTITTVTGITDVTGAVTEDAAGAGTTLTNTGMITFEDVDLLANTLSFEIIESHTISIKKLSGSLDGILTTGTIAPVNDWYVGLPLSLIHISEPTRPY